MRDSIVTVPPISRIPKSARMSQTRSQNEPEPADSPPRGFFTQLTQSFGMRITAAGLTFAVVPVCTHTLGTKGFGEYAIAMASMNILVVVAKLGFDTATLRYVAQYRSQGEAGLLRGFVSTSRRFTLAASIVIAIGLAGVTMLLQERLLQERMSEGVFGSLLIAALMLPVVAGIQLREVSLLATGRVMAGQAGGVLMPLLLMGLIGIVPAVTVRVLSSASVMFLNLCGAVITLGVLLAMTRRPIGVSSGGATSGGASAESGPSEARVGEWLSVASPLLMAQLLNLLLNQSGTLMCGSLIGTEAAGIYAAVARVSSVLFLGLQAINTIAAPTIAGLFHSGQPLELERYVRRCSLASFAFAATFALVMLAAGRSVLGLLGDEFVSGYVPMVVMLGGLALASAAGPVIQLMLMTGRQWDCITVFGTMTAISLLSGYFLIPSYGVLGAAITAAVARIGTSLALLVLARRRHGLWCIAAPLPAAPPPISAPQSAAA